MGNIPVKHQTMRLSSQNFRRANKSITVIQESQQGIIITNSQKCIPVFMGIFPFELETEVSACSKSNNSSINELKKDKIEKKNKKRLTVIGFFAFKDDSWKLGLTNQT